jgi:hypothetical protein
VKGRRLRWVDSLDGGLRVPIENRKELCACSRVVGEGLVARERRFIGVPLGPRIYRFVGQDGHEIDIFLTL